MTNNGRVIMRGKLCGEQTLLYYNVDEEAWSLRLLLKLGFVCVCVCVFINEKPWPNEFCMESKRGVSSSKTLVKLN